MSVADFLREVAITEPVVERSYDHDGKSYPFKLRRFADIDEYLKAIKAEQGRRENRKLHKGKLPTSVPAELVAGLETNFPEIETAKGDKVILYLESDEAIYIATRLEAGVVEPKMSWGEAVVFVKVNCSLATEIAYDIAQLNAEDAKAAAKKDLSRTADEAESES